jgi:hypothetical protein
MPPSAAVRRQRESIVRKHMDSENRHEFDATLGTFDHPRYELVATDKVYDGLTIARGLIRRLTGR